MHHLVQKHREVEHREALHDRKRKPDQRLIEDDESPGPQPKDGKLTRGHQQVAPGRLRVKRAQHITWHGRPELGAEGGSVLYEIGFAQARGQRLQDSAQLFVALGGGWWQAKIV